jgi:hypothetical protein
MTSVHNLAKLYSNNDLCSHCCNHYGGSTGVSKPSGQGMGEEAHGTKSMAQQVQRVSPGAQSL